MITTIFFDIGNVLFGFDHTLIWQRLAPFSVYPPEELRQQIQESGLMNQHERGQLPPSEFFHEVRQQGKLLPSFSYQTFHRFWADIFWEHMSTLQLAASLQTHYKIGLLSNIGEIHWNWLLNGFPILDQIHPNMRVLSFQVGFLKPSTAIYQEALERSESEAEECVYIDDIEDFVSTGRELGIQGIHYQSPEQLKQELEALQIMTSSRGT